MPLALFLGRARAECAGSLRLRLGSPTPLRETAASRGCPAHLFHRYENVGAPLHAPAAPLVAQMRLLLLLTGCRAGDHDLLIDRAYWARRLPLTLAENGSANEFGRCGRGNGFDACKCYAPSLDTVAALATASLAWTLDASRLSAAITRAAVELEEADITVDARLGPRRLADRAPRRICHSRVGARPCCCVG